MMVPDPSSAARIEALVEFMTAEEKVAQLVCVGGLPKQPG